MSGKVILLALLLSACAGRTTPPVVVTPPVDTTTTPPADTVPPVVVTPPDTTPPPVVVDTTLQILSLFVKPDSVSVKPGATVQFCPFFAFKGGNTAMPAEYFDKPDCVLYYNNGVSTQHRPTTEQQRIANRKCIEWEATGGTIEAALCDET